MRPDKKVGLKLCIFGFLYVSSYRDLSRDLAVDIAQFLQAEGEFDSITTRQQLHNSSEDFGHVSRSVLYRYNFGSPDAQ